MNKPLPINGSNTGRKINSCIHYSSSFPSCTWERFLFPRNSISR
jgi:hypothetical protein